MVCKQLNIGLIHLFAAVTLRSFVYLTYDYSGVWLGAGALLALGGIRVIALHIHKVTGRITSSISLSRYGRITLSHIVVTGTRLLASSVIITLLVNLQETT